MVGQAGVDTQVVQFVRHVQLQREGDGVLYDAEANEADGLKRWLLLDGDVRADALNGLLKHFLSMVGAAGAYE